MFERGPMQKLWHMLHEGGGVQKSSISNHRHPNVFCGMRAPQLVIRNKKIYH